MNYTALRLLTGVGVGIALSKFVVEAGLALVAFRVQHCFVFRGKAPPSENPQGAVRPLTASSRGPS